MVYLDYAATTPVDERILAAMAPHFAVSFGNPSSIHRPGQDAEAAIEAAREKVAAVLGCNSAEVIFTSGGTESDNLAIRGAAMWRRQKTGAHRILSARSEHPAVTRTVEALVQQQDFTVHWLRP